MKTRRHLLPLASLAALALLAACSPGEEPLPENEPPAVTITKPSDGAILWENEPTLLVATAEDAEDGDLGADITWTSSRDGTLTPSAEGTVILSPGDHDLTASVSDSDGEVASDTVSVTVNVQRATHVVADGASLRLIVFDGGEVEELSKATIEGDVEELAIYGVTAHPTKPWLYTASLHEEDWGDARIDRFVVARDTISHDGVAFLHAVDGKDALSCVLGDEERCVPVGMVFSPDGSRLYVDDDQQDVIQVFAVDEAGDLEFLAEGAYTDVHGLTTDPSGTYLYNGSNVIEVTNDEPKTIFSGEGGNATSLITLESGPALISTGFTEAVALYSLADPLAPSLITEHYFGAESPARDLGFTAGLERIVTVGRNRVHSLSFDGTDIVLDDTYTADEELTIQYRGVDVAPDGSYALATWFASDDTMFGGMDLFEIDAEGALTRIDSQKFEGTSRVVFALP